MVLPPLPSPCSSLVQSVLDPMSLKPLGTIWSLHNVVFFVASTLHSDEISKFLDIYAQEMVMKE